MHLAEVRFNPDNKLVVTTNRDDSEAELTGPKKDGLVFEGKTVLSFDSKSRPMILSMRPARVKKQRITFWIGVRKFQMQSHFTPI
jgi:hypothetical protein